MAERKVFNKYIPPDFDPRLLPKGERPPNNQIKVRSMLPMTICCTQCGEYMGRGTKFNARQEEAIGLTYLGLKRWRFYLKCSSCSQEMTFLTDPENDHYVTEHGCTRNFEPWRIQQEIDKQYYNNDDDTDLRKDVIKDLEDQSNVVKNNLDLMDTVNEIQIINKNKIFVDHDKIIQEISKKRKREEKERNDDEERLNEFRKKRRKLNNDGHVEMVFNFKKRKKDDNEHENGDTIQEKSGDHEIKKDKLNASEDKMVKGNDVDNGNDSNKNDITKGKTKDDIKGNDSNENEISNAKIKNAKDKKRKKRKKKKKKIKINVMNGPFS